MLLDDNKQRYPILISLHKSGSTWINSFIHKRYRRIGLTTPPRNLYTEFFNLNNTQNLDHSFVKRSYKERIALLEQLRTFGLELNQKAHVPQIMPVWSWFKKFYKDYDILVCKRRNIFSHYISILFWQCIRDNVDERLINDINGVAPDHTFNDTDEDKLKSAIQLYNVSFKHNEKVWLDFIKDVRYLNDIVIKELDKPQVIWLEDIDHAWLEKRFHVIVKKTTRPNTIDQTIYFKPKDMAIIKEKFKERFDNEFQFYGYEYK
jgi:hypothetical protein